jgi:hypothetical protein
MQYARKKTLAAKQNEKIDLTRLNFIFSLKAETCLTENRITPKIESTFNV